MALRSDVAEMLVRRGVLRAQRHEYFARPYTRDADRDWLVIDADPETVRHALAQLLEQVRRREQYRNLPQNTRSSKPTQDG